MFITDIDFISMKFLLYFVFCYIILFILFFLFCLLFNLLLIILQNIIFKTNKFLTFKNINMMQMKLFILNFCII